MTRASIIDGKAIAEALRTEVAAGAAQLKRERDITPGLAVVLVGEDPASQVYVRTKARQTREAGMLSLEHKLPADTSQAALLDLIAELNRRPDVHGILVQLPLPKHIDSGVVIEAIDPAKDVDGFHPVNVGRLASGGRALVPCTPSGCLILAKTVRPELAGLEAVVIGRSNIVGKPMAQLLLAESCTVTIAHSRTRNLPDVVRRADLVVAAVGRAEMVKGGWIKPGAIVIDVGIQRVATPDGKGRLVGDVAFEEVARVAGAITPVPGGVGPMTVACLLKNTLEAASRA
ncbi:MAG: bifunctional methylenetetrahydrofolate dehydrogenase/methenyltetrahydrofolate cyclohydrolase FolD [Hyphomicrobiaceae bacterium]